MATQTRRITERSARFFRATVKASMVAACCGLVLMSAVAAHAMQAGNGLFMNGLPYNGLPLNGITTNGIPLNGMPLNGVALNGLPMNGMAWQGMPIQGMPRNGLPMNGVPLNSLSANEGSLPPVQRESLPWSTLSSRPLGTSTP